MILGIKDFRLPIANFRLAAQFQLELIHNWQLEIGNRKCLRSSAAQPSAPAEETLVISHDELGLDLGNCVHGHSDQDQQRGAAEVKLIAHARWYPGKTRSAADECV